MEEAVPGGARSRPGGNKASFSVVGDFDGSKIPQTALVGVYETCRGGRGSFLLILARPQGKPQVVRFVHLIRDPDLQFANVAVMPNGIIHMLHCVECDHATSFKWDKAKRRFVRLPSQRH